MRHMTLAEVRRAGRESLYLRGTLDMCVLSLVDAMPTHAYGVVQELQTRDFPQTSYGTIYPLVTRLRRQGLLTQQSLPGSGGPAKNLLSLTANGQAALAAWQQEWRDHNARVESLLGGMTMSTTTKGTSHVN